MAITQKNYNWNGGLLNRSKTNYIVLHHAAISKASAEDIHRMHLNKGWTGIGYHFYVRKDGSIYTGRPIGTVGAQAEDYNDRSIGICFEGNFENKTMPDAQIKAGREVLAYVKKQYPGAKVVKHKELNATACPGKHFPFEKIVKEADKMTTEDAIKIIRDKVGLENETINFLMCYKYGEELLTKIAEAVI